MSESPKRWVCNGTLLTDEQAAQRFGEATPFIEWRAKVIAEGDPFWSAVFAEGERQAAEAKRVMDKAVALASWSTRAQAAADAFTPSRAMTVEDLAYMARISAYTPKSERSREWCAAMAVPGVRSVDGPDAIGHMKVWVAADTTYERMSETAVAVRQRMPATVRIEVAREEEPI